MAAPAAAVDARVLTENGSLVTTTLIAVEVKATSVESAVKYAVSAASDGATAVQFCVDHIAHLNGEADFPMLLQAVAVPAIISCKSKEEGGAFTGEEEVRLSILRQAATLGADFVEVELNAASSFFKVGDSAFTKSTKTKIIVGERIKDSTPPLADLLALAEKIQAAGADVAKIVTTAKDIGDNDIIGQLLQNSKIPTIAYADDLRGEISRLLSPKFSSLIVYAEPVGDNLIAETETGALPAKVLAEVYGLKRVGKKTKLFGVIGKPIKQSRGFLLYNSGMIEKGFDGIYMPLLVDDVVAFFKTYLRSPTSDFAGLSVTAPHKQAAMANCDTLDPAAEVIGAVSCIIKQANGQLIGYNADYPAAVWAIEQGLITREGAPEEGKSPLDGKLVIMAGAGGAGRAIAYGVKNKGATLVIADADETRAKALASEWESKTTTVAELKRPNAAAELAKEFGGRGEPVLAHVTPVGMFPNVNDTLFTKDVLGGFGVVFDAVYNPHITRLQKEAAAAGCSPVSGVDMFVKEAEDQFTLFTGLPAPGETMRKVLLDNLSSQADAAAPAK